MIAAIQVSPLRVAPARVLFRAFDRLRRTNPSRSWSLTASPEERLCALLAMERELNRRGVRGLGFVI